MKTIVCYGDSNTWGYMPKRERPQETTLNRFPWGVRWTSLLQEQLGAAYRVVVEGLNALPGVKALAAKYHVEMPIVNMVDAIVSGHVPVRDAVDKLMGRRKTTEFSHS